MFQTILLAYDGSPSSVSALRYAADLAARYNAELHLLGIVDTAGAVMSGEAGVNDPRWMEKDHIQQAMNLAAIELGKQGLDVVIEARPGDPATEIAAYAGQIKADLAIVGHTGKGILGRLFGGSVGTDLVNHLPCHLLITAKDA